MKNRSYNLILASKSPRRKDLLSELNIAFKVFAQDVPEDDLISDPKELVEVLAAKKASHTFDVLTQEKKEKNPFVIGGDTVVCFKNKIFGKPVNSYHAFSMLSDLSGGTHEVISGVAFVYKDGDGQKKIQRFSEVTQVSFSHLSGAQIREYIHNFRPFDKAGSYGLQEMPHFFIEKIDGSLSNVIGLPTARLAKELEKTGAIFSE